MGSYGSSRVRDRVRHLVAELSAGLVVAARDGIGENVPTEPHARRRTWV
jgi:hypothetical protein